MYYCNMSLWDCVKENLRDGENIYILRDKELLRTYLMHEHTFDSLFNTYSGDETVKRYWHEDGLCIILK